MSFRPAGTDGSDHQYRETIEQAYKVLARTRKWAGYLQYLSVLPGLLRAAWFIGGHHIGGLNFNIPAAFIIACHLLGVVAWTLAKVGTSRESFALVRISGGLHLLWFAVLLTSGFKYHFIVQKELHTDTRVLLYLQQTYGAIGDSMRHVVEQLDAALDAILFTTGCLLFSNVHPYIMVQINLKKRAESIQTEGTGGQEAAGASARALSAPASRAASARNEAGVVKRRPGRA